MAQGVIATDLGRDTPFALLDSGFVRLPARALICSPVLPPHDSGQAVVLGRLFRAIHPEDYRLVAFGSHAGRAAEASSGMEPLPARTFRFDGVWGPPGRSPLQPVRDARRFAAETLRRALRLARLIRRERCRVLVASTGMLPSLPSAVLAARLANVPVVLQVFDHWRYQEVEPRQRRLAAWLEGPVLRAGDVVTVPNELLAESIVRLDGVEPVVVRNPVDDAALWGARAPVPWPAAPDQLRIVYTGQVYSAQLDGVKRLLAAIEEPGLEAARLHFYGLQSEADLEAMGLHGKLVCHPFVPPPAIYRVHQTADVLFLPLAFTGVHQEIIRTSSTTKFADYLASGRPTLIHTPPGAFPAWYAARHGCGLVLDAPDPGVLAAALRLLRRDAALRDRLGGNGLDRARADFSVAVARDGLVAAIAKAVGSG